MESSSPEAGAKKPKTPPTPAPSASTRSPRFVAASAPAKFKSEGSTGITSGSTRTKDDIFDEKKPILEPNVVLPYAYRHLSNDISSSEGKELNDEAQSDLVPSSQKQNLGSGCPFCCPSSELSSSYYSMIDKGRQGKDHKSSYNKRMAMRIKGLRCDDTFFGLGSRSSSTSIGVGDIQELWKWCRKKELLNGYLSKESLGLPEGLLERYNSIVDALEEIPNFHRKQVSAILDHMIGLKRESDIEIENDNEIILQLFNLDMRPEDPDLSKIAGQITATINEFQENKHKIASQIALTFKELKENKDESTKKPQLPWGLLQYIKDICDIAVHYLTLLQYCINNDDRLQLCKLLSYRKNPHRTLSTSKLAKSHTSFPPTATHATIKSAMSSGGGAKESISDVSSLVKCPEWWAPAKSRGVETENFRAPTSSFLLIYPQTRRKTAPLQYIKDFNIDAIYREKGLSYMKRDKSSMRTVEAKNESMSSSRDRYASMKSVWEGNECVVTLTKEYKGVSVCFPREFTMLHRSFEFPNLPYVPKNLKSEKYVYKEIPVSGNLYQFKSSVPDEGGKSHRIDRFPFLYDGKPLSFILQASFVDRFGTEEPPRFVDKKKRFDTYKHKGGEFLERIKENRRKVETFIQTENVEVLVSETIVTRLESPRAAVEIKSDTSESATVNLNLSLQPEAIRDYDQCYKVNEAKLGYLVQKLKEKERNRAITVFISSPFDGCDDERNYFKVQIETLKSYCFSKGIFLKVVNFQWGITDHLTKQNKTILRCMEAIDEADIFIGYYGARYGSAVVSKPENKDWLYPAVDRCIWWPGKVVQVRGDGTFDVEYDNGKSEVKVSKDMMRPVVLSEGDIVKAAKSKWFSGMIINDRKDKTYEFQYDDGQKADKIPEAMIQMLAGSSGFAKDMQVKARKWFYGKLVSDKGEGKAFEIEYEDGDSDVQEKDFIRFVETARKSNVSCNFKAGDEVKVHKSAYDHLYACRDQSVTSMEWQHAFLHGDFSTRQGELHPGIRNKPISFFFFRNGEYDAAKTAELENLKEGDLATENDKSAKKWSWYKTENETSRLAIFALKEEVKGKATQGGLSYASVFEDYADPKEGADLMYNCCNALIRKVIDSLHIHDKYDKHDAVYLNQLAFSNARLAFHSDWDNRLKIEINKYLEGERSKSTRNYPFVLTGLRGSGKSSHLAKIVDNLLTNSNSKLYVIYHFCGCDRVSQKLSCLMERLLFEFSMLCKTLTAPLAVNAESIMNRLAQINPTAEESFNEVMDLIDCVMVELNNIALVIVIDGLDHLDEIKYRSSGDIVHFPSDLSWLPPNGFHARNLKVIFSCLEGSKVYKALKDRRDYTIYRIPKLAKEDIRAVIRTWHETYLKDVDDSDMKDLFESKQCEEVMFLSLLLNQLLVYGTWNTIHKYRVGDLDPNRHKDNLIKRLLESTSIPSLIKTIIVKKGELLNSKLPENCKLKIDILEDVMCYLYCSRSGLMKDELEILLKMKHPELALASLSIDYENDLSSILSYRLNMLTIEHRYVFDAIERAYLLKDNTFAELEEYMNTIDSPEKYVIEKTYAEGKKKVIQAREDLIKMFRAKGSEQNVDIADEAYVRLLQELEYHEREANMRPSVIVAVRCRPFRMLKPYSRSIIDFKRKTALLTDPISKIILEPPPKFNLVFDEKSSQETIFMNLGKDIVEQVKNGHDSSIIAYGQTGTGKTYTMLGDNKLGEYEGNKLKLVVNKDELGLIPRIVGYLLSELKSDEATLDWMWNVSCTAVEIYKERAYDLLGTNKDNLQTQLRRMKNQNIDYSVDTIKMEMKEKGCANMEALQNKIDTMGEELKKLTRKKDALKCEYTKKHEELFALIDIRKRYDRETAKPSEKGNALDIAREVSIDERIMNEEMDELGFKDIQSLEKEISESALTNGRFKKLTSFLDRYKLATSPLNKIKNKISTPLDNEKSTISTYNIRFKKMEKDFRGISIKSYDNFHKIMEQIYINRRSAETSYNDRSSRSHLILTLKITREDKKKKREPQEVKINLVDLAGSESALKIGCEKLEETISTNRSLSVLKKCIKALCKRENKSKFFPFRESLLTKILQDSLAGLDNKLILIGTLSCQEDDYDETKETLKYISLASNMTNGRNFIAESEALRRQQENEEAKSYLCSQFGVSDNHIDKMKEFYLRHCLPYNSSWTKELARWRFKLHQFKSKFCNPIAWISGFSARSSEASEPRYLKVRENEAFGCSVDLFHFDSDANSEVYFMIDDDLNTKYLLSNKNGQLTLVDTVELKAPAISGIYMLRVKAFAASKPQSPNLYCDDKQDWIDDFVAWIHVSNLNYVTSGPHVSKKAEFGPEFFTSLRSENLALLAFESLTELKDLKQLNTQEVGFDRKVEIADLVVDQEVLKTGGGSIAATKQDNDGDKNIAHLPNSKLEPPLKLTGNLFDIFLSHLWSEKHYVRHIKTFLSDAGYNIWSDMDNMDHKLGNSMKEGIDNSKVFLVCIHRNYEASKNCMLELDHAVSRGKPIIVLLTDKGAWDRKNPDGSVKEKGWASQSMKEKIGMHNQSLFVDLSSVCSDPRWKPNFLDKINPFKNRNDVVGYEVPKDLQKDLYLKLGNLISLLRKPQIDCLASYDASGKNGSSKDLSDLQAENKIMSQDMSSLNTVSDELNGKGGSNSTKPANGKGKDGDSTTGLLGSALKLFDNFWGGKDSNADPRSKVFPVDGDIRDYIFDVDNNFKEEHNLEWNGWDPDRLTIYHNLDEGRGSGVFKVGYKYVQYGRSLERFYALKLFNSITTFEEDGKIEMEKVPEDRIRSTTGSYSGIFGLSEGDEVVVNYQDEWLPGTISTRHFNGTYDIIYDRRKMKQVIDYNWNIKLALEEQRTLEEIKNRLSKLNAEGKVIQCHKLFRGEVKNEKMREKLNILRTDRWKVGLLLTLGEGGSLKQLITDDIVSQWDTLFRLEVYLNICSCLSDLHSSGITHKDLTSANILLRHPLGKNKKADILICDLGLAKINKIISSKTYAVGRTISLPSGKSSSKIEGTYPYFAPEVLKNLPTCNSRFVDIYANAIIGWELFEGKMYFDIFNNNASQLNDLEPNIYNRKTVHDSVVDLVCETKTNGALGNNSRPPLNIQTAVEGASPGTVAFPPRIADMLRLCWDADRSKRLTSQECVERVKYTLEIEKGNKFDVFLSHMWLSKSFVYFIYEYLNSKMFNTRYDVKNMDHDIELSIETGVKNSEVFLCCLSEAYQTKPNCMREFDDAVRLNKKIVVILLQTFDFWEKKPLWKKLSTTHSCSSTCTRPCDKKWDTSWEVDARILNAMKHKEQANGSYTVDMMFVDVSDMYEDVEWVNIEQSLKVLKRMYDEIDPSNIEEKRKLLEEKNVIYERRRGMAEDLHEFLDKKRLNVLLRANMKLEDHLDEEF